MKYLLLIASNLRRHKLRTLLTVLSILIAFLLYGYLCAIKNALLAGINMQDADRLIVRHKVSIAQLLPVSYQSRIARIPGVAEVTHATWFGGNYQDPPKFFAQMPVEPEKYLSIYQENLVSQETLDLWMRTKTGALVGRKTAERFGWKVGDRIPLMATIWPKKNGDRTWEFDIVGIYDGLREDTDTTMFFMRYDYFDKARQYGEGLVGWYIVRVTSSDIAAQVAAQIDAEFANSPYETKAETEGAFVRAFAKQVGDIGTMVAAILGAVFFTILLVAGNTMAQAVRERTEELGVLKALGFTNVQVLGFVLAESCLLSVVGGFAGLAIAWGLIAQGDPTGGALPMFYLPKEELALGVCYVLVLGLITGLVPALQAMRLRIAEALRRM